MTIGAQEVDYTPSLHLMFNTFYAIGREMTTQPLRLLFNAQRVKQLGYGEELECVDEGPCEGLELPVEQAVVHTYR